MRFVIENLAGSARSGHIEVVTSRGALATPAALLRSRGGAVPHLTQETLQYLETGNNTLLIPFQYHAKQTKILQAYKKGLSSFMGMKDSLSVLTVQDPGEQTKSGYNEKNTISVWCGSNREIISVRCYMEFVEAAKPDIAVALCDGDTQQNSSQKRINKAAKKTLDFLDTFTELKERGCDVSVIAAVQGGFDTQIRKKSAIETSKRNVDGFLLDGFHNNGQSAESLTWDQMKESALETLFHLPKEKPRFYFGPVAPDLLVELVGAGVDVFDTSYPNLVTERDSYLVFNNKFVKNFVPEERETKIMFEKKVDCPENVNAMKPLVKGCTCYTCRNFTLAYVHHLVNVKEMLGRILLSLHNLHHYEILLQSVRQAIQADQLHLIQKQILSQTIL